MGNKTRQEQDKDAHSPHSLLNTALKIPAVQRKDFSLMKISCREKNLRFYKKMLELINSKSCGMQNPYTNDKLLGTEIQKQMHK